MHSKLSPFDYLELAERRLYRLTRYFFDRGTRPEERLDEIQKIQANLDDAHDLIANGRKK